MCGISGVVNWGDPADFLALMTDIQAHRGPDDSGVWRQLLNDGTWAGLGNRRLAILDMSAAGHMPMSDPDGQYWITYNGEVYNFSELRAELEARGYSFRSGTDTEVVLNLYREMGPDCVTRLNGMFAFAIWDGPGRRMFLARDHFGIKPLYYTNPAGRLAFASEAKALLCLPGFSPEMDPLSLDQFLTLLWVPEPRTIYRDVHKLPAGHYAIFEKGELRLTQYWDLRFPQAEATFAATEAELIEEARERLLESVRRQKISDVPLGCFLSAGMDSSSIVACLSRLSSTPVRTFTIAFPPRYAVGETTLDDPRVAAETARTLGCHHTEIVVEPQVADLLPQLLWHMDEPVADPAIIATYLVCREARKSVTVLLSGVGGDEVFGGYRKYLAHYLARLYQWAPGPLRRNMIEPVVRALPSFRGSSAKGMVRLLKKMARSGSLPPEERFLLDSTYLLRGERQELYTSAFRDRAATFDPYAAHRDCFGRVRASDFLNQMLYLDSKQFMVSLNLNYSDKMSMANSVEVRVPFLDRELVEWAAWNVPPGLKIHHMRTKYLLRKAMAPWLPAQVLRQKKAGFGAPVDYWLAHDLRDMVRDVLNDHAVRQRGLFEVAGVRKLIQKHESGREDRGMQLWQLLTLELWLQNAKGARPAANAQQAAGAVPVRCVEAGVQKRTELTWEK